MELIISPWATLHSWRFVPVSSSVLRYITHDTTHPKRLDHVPADNTLLRDRYACSTEETFLQYSSINSGANAPEIIESIEENVSVDHN